MLSYAYNSIVAALTAFAMLISVSSCSVEPQATLGTSSQAVVALGKSESEVIHILQADSDISLEFQEALKTFSIAQNNGTTFSVQTVAGKEDYRAALRTRLLSGQPTDLFVLQQAGEADSFAPYLADLSALEWAGDDSTQLPILRSEDGASVGIPYSLEGIGLIVNREIFSAADIDVNDIHDFEGLTDAFGDLQKAINSGNLSEDYPELKAVTDFAGLDSSYISQYFTDLMLVDSFTDIQQASRALSATIIDKESAEEYIKLLARHSPHSSRWSDITKVSQHDILENGIATERIAAVLHDTQSYQRIYSQNPELSGKLTLLPLYLPQNEHGTVFIRTPYWWSMSFASSESIQQQCAELLTWLYQTSDGSEILKNNLKLLSPYNNRLQQQEIALQQRLLSFMDNGYASLSVANETPSGWSSEALVPQLHEYLSTYDKTWDEVIQLCNEDWISRRSEE